MKIKQSGHIIIFIFQLFVSTLCYSQEQSISTPDLSAKITPNLKNPDFEVIILDGDTVLKSIHSSRIIRPSFEQSTHSSHFISTDWFNSNWDTNRFDAYSNDEKPSWPVSISLIGQNFHMPIHGKVTSRFGWRKGRPHNGIDIDLVTGDNVHVAWDGRVRFAKYYSGFGNVVVVRHSNGLETVYAHLSKILVYPGTNLKAGQVVGKGGNTGRSYGSHLHFEIRYKNEPINPEYFIDFEEKEAPRGQDFLVTSLWADPGKHRSYKQSHILVQKPSQTSSTLVVENQPAKSFEKNPTEYSNFKKAFSKPSTLEEDDNSMEVSSEQYHTISAGENLYRISKLYNTTIDELTKLNHISKTSTLSIGQKIRVR